VIIFEYKLEFSAKHWRLPQTETDEKMTTIGKFYVTLFGFDREVFNFPYKIAGKLLQSKEIVHYIFKLSQSKKQSWLNES
jgi:hypothetical protein